VDVKGKLVLMEPEAPVTPPPTPEANADEFKKWRPYTFHDYKVKNASSHAAAGMIYNYHIANPNCVFVKNFLLSYVGTTVVNDLFTGTGKKHDAVVQSIRQAKKPASFDLAKTMTVKNVTEHHPEGIGLNVVAVIDGTDPALKNEAIVIGAHLDHLGLNDTLMPGANDNASADAVLLGAAQALARSGIALKRTVVFVLFGAEEQGVKGSEYYVAHPVVPNNRVKVMLNLESVGHGDRITASAGGGNYADAWASFERNNTKYVHRQISVRPTANLARPRQDAAHFMWANVPTLGFGAGGGRPIPVPTYHTTHDTPEYVNPEILEDLARLVYLAVVEIANAPAGATH
jgi:acetylornithine deacetylase/succinyl-diaminopimelate desuccinylase-like protein